ncbi:hypothetical protein H7F10_15130 [Acidithiobacillus sp. HP-6]|uniref:hypothetical protein n=1 Tax=unclassified Acidithiobacillus TaxID=2614800 RepID=UPI00187A5F69|nr:MULTISPECIES: hypothetical protein [unclassified Acidithiobacillus]MBE7564230.1 hypothetical protein [Acidithiobacillus sp. HP-6]MBE7570689.1 hypothetical protein [Acidithiobacillus sp. HP-2]MDD2750282.1 hypothetical protein [Acidithiobacillus sp.]MDD5280489.1 hypothetical protein [Acidithiobacillus sp.]
MAPRKSPRSRKKPWILVVIIALITAAIAIGIALNIPISPQSVSPTPEKPVPKKTNVPKLMKKTLDLGSFGVMVRSADGSEKALTIHPVAILHGHGPWQPLHDAQNHFESLIVNPFMAFPDLNQVSHSPTAQQDLGRQIMDNIAPTLARLEPGWTIEHIELHPALQEPPP